MRYKISELRNHWQQADGSMIHPTQMTNKHLVCTLRMLERLWWRRMAQRIRYITSFMEANKGSHSMYVELEEQMHMITNRKIADAWPIHTYLSNELDRRILSAQFDPSEFGYEEGHSLDVRDSGLDRGLFRFWPSDDVHPNFRHAGSNAGRIAALYAPRSPITPSGQGHIADALRFW